jgi:hypothetical protein
MAIGLFQKPYNQLKKMLILTFRPKTHAVWNRSSHGETVCIDWASHCLDQVSFALHPQHCNLLRNRQ